MPREFRMIDGSLKYESLWLKVVEYKVERDGKLDPRGYAVVERADGVIVILESDDGETLFLNQYRFPTKAYEWELPMGGIDPGETPLQAAERELWEETGLRGRLVEIGQFYPVPGLTPQRVTVFKAELSDSNAAKVLKFDQVVDEIVDRRILAREDIQSMIASGEISDGFTLSALALSMMRG